MHLRRSAGDVPTLLALGVCLIEMDRLGEAGEKFRRAIEQDPRCAQAHFHLGELALLADHLDAAERRLEQARQLDDAMPGVYLRLAQVAHQRHREEAARARLFEEVRRFLAEPGATGILAAQPLRCGPQGRALDLAHMLLAIGEPFTVGEVLDRLDSLGLAPRPEERALACNYRSRACLMTGQARAAARWARLSRHAKRDNPLAAYHLAMAYHRLHRPHAALAAIRRALHADPQDADLQRAARQINRAVWWNRLRRWLHLPRLSSRRSPAPDSGPD
jgi:tetratricopeptide (TPR) repeat protein